MENVYVGRVDEDEYVETISEEGPPGPSPYAKPRSGLVLSHWHKLFENFQASPMEFYAAVEEALKPRQIPEASTWRVIWKEAGAFSAKREYLRVSRGKLSFEICGAPFGTGFFFSSWLTEALPHGLFYTFVFGVELILLLYIAIKFTGIVLGILLVLGFEWFRGFLMSEKAIPGEDTALAMPLIGWLYEHLYQPNTYYKRDTALMFQSAVHSAMLEVIDSMTSAKGIRGLSELERKPVLKEFLQK
jgi:hypothetical protein